MESLEEVKSDVLNGNFKWIGEKVKKALSEGIPANKIFNAMSESIKIVGNKFGEGEVFLPELMASAQSMKLGMEILKPEIRKQKVSIKKLGKVIIGTNKGDIHDIGKSLVVMMLENAGFEVIDLGVDISAEKFIEETKKHNPDIIGMSALLTSALMGQQDVIEKLKEENLRGNIKVIIGGAPATEEWAKKIGADEYGSDANQAVLISKKLLNKTD